MYQSSTWRAYNKLWTRPRNSKQLTQLILHAGQNECLKLESDAEITMLHGMLEKLKLSATRHRLVLTSVPVHDENCKKFNFGLSQLAAAYDFVSFLDVTNIQSTTAFARSLSYDTAVAKRVASVVLRHACKFVGRRTPKEKKENKTEPSGAATPQKRGKVTVPTETRPPPPRRETKPRSTRNFNAQRRSSKQPPNPHRRGRNDPYPAGFQYQVSPFQTATPFAAHANSSAFPFHHMQPYIPHPMMWNFDGAPPQQMQRRNSRI